jgi:hypothetical protein
MNHRVTALVSSTGLTNDAPVSLLPLRVLAVQPRVYFDDHRTGVLVHLANYRQEAWVACYEPPYRENCPVPPLGQCLQATLGPPAEVNGYRPLLGWQPVPPEAAGVAWLPRSWAVRPEELIRLHAQVEAVRTPELQALLHRILSAPAIARNFLRLPASRDHHHSWPGGLLSHSLETVDLLLGQWQATAVPERDLLTTGGLLHDVGKVRVYREDGSYTETGLIVHHDELTLELLAPELARLPARLADALRHLLCRSARARRYPHSALRTALWQADRLSAERDQQARAFEHLPGYRLRSRDSRGQSRYRLPPQGGG